MGSTVSQALRFPEHSLVFVQLVPGSSCCELAAQRCQGCSASCRSSVSFLAPYLLLPHLSRFFLYAVSLKQPLRGGFSEAL